MEVNRNKLFKAKARIVSPTQNSEWRTRRAETERERERGRQKDRKNSRRREYEIDTKRKTKKGNIDRKKKWTVTYLERKIEIMINKEIYSHIDSHQCI